MKVSRMKLNLWPFGGGAVFSIWLEWSSSLWVTIDQGRTAYTQYLRIGPIHPSIKKFPEMRGPKYFGITILNLNVSIAIGRYKNVD